MATNFLWGNVGGSSTLLSTELNSLANGSASAYGTEFNNSNGPQLCQLWLHLASNSLTFNTASYVKIYFVPSTTPDSSSGTYPSFTSGSSFKLAEPNYLSAFIYLCPAAFSSAVTDDTGQFFQLPSGYFKPILVNLSGSTLPASGNTLKINTTPLQY